MEYIEYLGGPKSSSQCEDPVNTPNSSPGAQNVIPILIIYLQLIKHIVVWWSGFVADNNDTLGTS